MSTLDEMVSLLELTISKFPPLPRGIEIKISGDSTAVTIRVRDLTERLQNLFSEQRWAEAGGNTVSYRRFQRNLDQHQVDLEEGILYDFFQRYPTEASYQYMFGSKKQIELIRTILAESGHSWQPF